MKNDAFKTFYKSIDEIFEHAKSIGYIPKIKEQEHGFIEVDFYLPDGITSPFSRTYDKLEDGRYEFVEEAW